MTQLTKVLAIFCLPLLLIAQSEDQPKYYLAELDYIKVKMGMEDKFIDAVKKHNDKYHDEAPYSASLYRIMTGPESGWFVWTMGGFTFTDFDDAPGEGAHNDDWRKTIQPYVEEYGPMEFWRYAQKLSHSDEDDEPMEELWFMDIERGEYYRFRNFMEKVHKIHINKDEEIQVWTNQFSSNDGRDVAIAWPFDKWAERDANEWNMKEAFNEEYGEGSWDDALEEWEEFVSSMTQEIWSRIL